MNLLAVPEDTMLQKGGVWVIAGPGWRDHVAWRVRKMMDSGVPDTYWMGSGHLGNRFPPSGVLTSPSSDVTRLVKNWTEHTGSSSTLQRLLVVEDPQGAGIWDSLNRSASWKTLLENAIAFRCAVIIGTDIGIPRSGLLLEYTDWFHLRSGGGTESVEDLTSGMTSLGAWLDGVGRDVFDDIRVYRRILGVMSGHRKDVVIWLSNESEDFTDRVFWWNPTTEKEDIEPLHNLRRATNPAAASDGATAMVAPRLVRKLRLIIGLLKEVCDELDPDGSSDDDE